MNEEKRLPFAGYVRTGTVSARLSDVSPIREVREITQRTSSVSFFLLRCLVKEDRDDVLPLYFCQVGLIVCLCLVFRYSDLHMQRCNTNKPVQNKRADIVGLHRGNVISSK